MRLSTALLLVVLVTGMMPLTFQNNIASGAAQNEARNILETQLHMLGDMKLGLLFQANGTQVIDISRYRHKLTWNKNGSTVDIASFDTPPTSLGHGYAVEFNGLDEGGVVLDHDSLTFEAGKPMSIVLLMAPDLTTNVKPFGKYNGGCCPVGGEWGINFSSSGYTVPFYRDQSENSEIATFSSTPTQAGVWQLWVGTWDGGGILDSARQYKNGLLDDDRGQFTYYGFVAMENTTVDVGVGADPRLHEFYPGAIAFAAVYGDELTQSGNLALAAALRAYFGLDLS